jgi:hypothetical protein
MILDFYRYRFTVDEIEYQFNPSPGISSATDISDGQNASQLISIVSLLTNDALITEWLPGDEALDWSWEYDWPAYTPEWSTIQSEIDANRPFMSCIMHPNPSTGRHSRIVAGYSTLSCIWNETINFSSIAMYVYDPMTQLLPEGEYDTETGDPWYREYYLGGMDYRAMYTFRLSQYEPPN